MERNWIRSTYQELGAEKRGFVQVRQAFGPSPDSYRILATRAAIVARMTVTEHLFGNRKQGRVIGEKDLPLT
jgi:hypothetical protein